MSYSHHVFYKGQPAVYLPLTKCLRYASAFLCAALFGGSITAKAQAVPALVYTEQNRGPAPIPPSEFALQTITAEPWFKVSEKSMQLEGPAVDRAGKLFFADVYGGRVLRLTPDRQFSSIVTREGWTPGGIAIHKDGRIFVASAGDSKGGSILALQPDGTGIREILPELAGYRPNDLVFDAHGGFYFTDFKGTSTEPQGAVYYVPPNDRAIISVLPRVSLGNGVALSPDGKDLWITEFGRNLLDRIELLDATTIAAFGSVIAYHFTGPAPDSMRADADGNLYVAMYGQGRVLVFNKNGIPIGQVLLPGRQEGHNLRSTSMAIRPGTNDLYIVSSDAGEGEGATIFHAKAFAKALVLYAQQ
jgi:lactonase